MKRLCELKLFMQLGMKSNKKGFSIVEMVIASSIIVLAAVAFLPVFSFVAQAGRQNKERLTASTLASSVIEEIRAMDYDDVGTEGGNPSGSVPQQEKKTIDGVEYIINTSIDWMSAKGKDGRTNDIAYKRVRVTVKAPSAFSGSVQKLDEIHSIVSREGEEPIYEAGGIRVIIRNAKNEPYMGQTFTIDIKNKSGTPANSYYGPTIDGEKYFGIIPQGKYVVKVEVPEGINAIHDEIIEDGWVVRDDVVVVNWQTTEVIVYMDREENLCDLYLNMVDNISEDIIREGGQLTLTWSMDERSAIVLGGKVFTVDDLDDATKEDGELHYASLIPDFFGKLWPLGRYSIKIENVPLYRTFDMNAGGVIKTDDGEDWGGAFNGIGQKLYSSAYIKPQYLFYSNEEIKLEKNYPDPLIISDIYGKMPNEDISAANAFDNDDETSWDIIRGDPKEEKEESVCIEINEVKQIGKIRIKLAADYKFHFTFYGSNEYGKFNDKIFTQENIETKDGVYEVELEPDKLPAPYKYYKIEIKLTQENHINEVSIVQIDLFDETAYGYINPRVELYGPIDLSRYSPAPRLIINWESSTPGGTEYDVYTAITNSEDEEPTLWSKANKGQDVPGITEGMDYTGKYLWIKEELNTKKEKETPIRSKLYIEIME
jgi:type II secretory pathway pseudopilin PulG